MQPTHWGLTVAEWLTIAAIVLGPFLAVATQLWVQARKSKRDVKVWVFTNLMGLRANFVNPTFVQAFNLVDVVFYKHSDIRDKRKEFMDFILRIGERDLTPQEVDRCRDLISEMLAKIGKVLGLVFDHTQIKDTGYYPKALGKAASGIAAITEKALAVLEGNASIGIVVRNEEPPPRMHLPR
jgi:uncharacterized protein DUF6680